MKRSKRIISASFFRAWHYNQVFSAKISFGMLLCVKNRFLKSFTLSISACPSFYYKVVHTCVMARTHYLNAIGI